MKTGDYAWLTLAAGVTAYEIAAALHPHTELLSEAVDRYRGARPIATYAAVVYLAGHLTRVWPQRWDPLSRISEALERSA